MNDLPDAYFQGLAAESRRECPFGVSTRPDRIARGWWLAGYHDGQMQTQQHITRRPEQRRP